jgi:hypothetical protein
VAGLAGLAGSCVELDGNYLGVGHWLATGIADLQGACIVYGMYGESPEVIVTRVVFTGVARGMGNELVPIAVQ